MGGAVSSPDSGDLALAAAVVDLDSGVADLVWAVPAGADQNPDSLDLAGAVLVVWVTLSLLPLYSPAEIP